VPTSNGLYYFSSGAENLQRPPTVLIHGAGGHHLYWPPQVRRLPGQRMVALDLPGHGKSGGIGHQTIEEYADDVMAFLDAMGFTTAVLIGHSMGGAVALEVALDHPERALGLCLLGSGAKLRVAPALLGIVAEPGSFGDAIALITTMSFAPQTSQRLRDLAAARLAEVRPSVLHGDFMACDAFDVTGRLGHFSAPTLVLCGEADQMTPPKYSDFLEGHIPGAHAVRISDAGHMVMLEQPDRVGELIGSFLETIPYHPGQ
jgi:pimeloyl-ACP methyl ester carboxylesterase